MEERKRFIESVLAHPKGNFAHLCRSFGISRGKGYKWVERFERGGWAALADRAPIAHACAHRTRSDVVDRVIGMRKEHPFDGPKKLRTRLMQLGVVDFDVPAASTIGDILKRYGLVRPRRARLRVPPSATPLDPGAQPNDVWCTDFKGHFALGDGSRCYPLTISDSASRFLIKCEALVEPKYEPVREHFERAFHEFGLPLKIRSDNGPPFATNALGGLSRLSVWWIRLGVLPERIEPGKPQQNGRHERMHRTLDEQTASPPQATRPEQQRTFDRFRCGYNESRPHEALGQTTPASHYEPSRRVMPAAPRSPEYGDELVVRRLSNNGHMSWAGKPVLVCRLLASEPIGLKQVDQDEWEIFYGPLLIGFLLVRNGIPRIEPLS